MKHQRTCGSSNESRTRPQFYFQQSEEDSSGSDEAEPATGGPPRASNPFRSLRKRLKSELPTARLCGKSIYFTRHGESEYNVLEKIGGNSQLSPRGILYAKALGRFFNAQNIPDLKIWTSSLKRTVQTASFIDGNGRERFPQLNEIDSGKLDGLTYDEFAHRYPVEFQKRGQDKFGFRYPGGESYKDCCERLLPFLQKFEHECRCGTSSTLLIVAHQAILRCIYGYLLSSEPADIPYIKIPQHTIMQLRWPGSDLDVADIADTAQPEPRECLIEFVRMPIDHAEQGVVQAALQL